MPSYSITYEIITMSDEEDGEPERVGGYYLPGGWHHEIPDGLTGDAFVAWCKSQGPFDIEVKPEDWIDFEPADWRGLWFAGERYATESLMRPIVKAAVADSEARAMAATLLYEGATECSGCPHHTGAWWSTPPDQDYWAGAYETHSYHLNGFTPEQEAFIAKLVKARNAHAEVS